MDSRVECCEPVGIESWFGRVRRCEGYLMLGWVLLGFGWCWGEKGRQGRSKKKVRGELYALQKLSVRAAYTKGKD